MTTTDHTTLWIVYNDDRDDVCAPDSAFTDKDTADAYAQRLGLDVEPVRLYGPGEQPEIVEGWYARAAVGPARVVAPHTGGPLAFGEHGYQPEWVKHPCELFDCSMFGSELVIVYRGNDRGAVLAACQARFDKAVAAMCPDGVPA